KSRARHERAGATRLAQHLAALDLAGVQRIGVDRRSGRLESRERDRDDGENHRGSAADDDLPDSFASFIFWAWYVHLLALEQRTCHASVRQLNAWFSIGNA